MNVENTKRPGARIKLAGINDLLGIKEDKGNQITYIPVEKIHPFSGHPFKVQNDAEFQKLLLSISNNGIITPVAVREKDGEYELISGHRRCMAARRLGIEKVPAAIKNMDDDNAVITMVDANLQRENLLPSERAKAYKMKFDAMVNLNMLKGDVVASMAALSGDDERTVRRYINLSRLITGLLDYLDDGRIITTSAEIISSLNEEAQLWIYDTLQNSEYGLEKDAALEIKEMYASGALEKKDVIRIISQLKARFPKLRLNLNTVKQYFTDEDKESDMQITIYKLLEDWMRRGRPAL